jgi:hypothetical protein
MVNTYNIVNKHIKIYLGVFNTFNVASSYIIIINKFARDILNFQP